MRRRSRWPRRKSPRPFLGATSRRQPVDHTNIFSPCFFVLTLSLFLLFLFSPSLLKVLAPSWVSMEEIEEERGPSAAGDAPGLAASPSPRFYAQLFLPAE